MIISEEVTGWILDEEDDDDEGIEISTLFLYDNSEPYTIGIQFTPDLIWEISREAMMECLRTGEGGFLNSVFISDGERLMMMLTSDDNESITIEFSHSELTSFIHVTYELVAEGKEEIDVDDLISTIFENTKLGTDE